ncbi:response regulator [Roseivivax sediminis]|uniref:Response regulator receiver domain-containing protein n=1 Tax=Roseivivax sediminis TaxID=936889 RepID=A0A1I2A9Y0_9RHOB|nr:response regulator [Roseivivax sediminis]SFE40537.1 Response regulator receiver domain-containing protein [Roseivivax sediminis]
MKILICEDEAVIALALEDLLEDLGHEVAGSVRDSSAALRVARERGAELAIVDLGLADGWGGPRLIDELSALGVGCIVVSGQAEDLDAPEVTVGVLSKPVDERKLAELISRHAQR